MIIFTREPVVSDHLTWFVNSHAPCRIVREQPLLKYESGTI